MTTAAPHAYDVITMGRVSVDIYPQQTGPLEDVTSFSKSVGGSATNVAIAAAQHGADAAADEQSGVTVPPNPLRDRKLLRGNRPDDRQRDLPSVCVPRQDQRDL